MPKFSPGPDAVLALVADHVRIAEVDAAPPTTGAFLLDRALD